MWQAQKGKGEGEMSKSGEMVPYPLSPIPLPFSHTGYCGSSLAAQWIFMTSGVRINQILD